jgi:hypothetical protein
MKIHNERELIEAQRKFWNLEQQLMNAEDFAEVRDISDELDLLEAAIEDYSYRSEPRRGWQSEGRFHE